MMSLSEKHGPVIDEAVEALISSAANSRGLGSVEVRLRVNNALEKYLFSQAATVGRDEIREFVRGIHADDLCLILACERGDERAWEDLISAFDPTVKSAARKICSNAEDAEDLARSIWAELYGLRQDSEGNKKSKLAHYSGRGSLAGWLRAVVAQLAIDQFRKQSKFVQIEEDREFENLAEASSNHLQSSGRMSHADSPEKIFSEKQVSEHISGALRTALADLEPEDRLILKLYYFDDLKLKDIGRAFGYHEATASRKLARIQADIRKSVQRVLHSRYGWKEAEVKRYLSDAASNAGISFEKLLGILIMAAVLQDLWL